MNAESFDGLLVLDKPAGLTSRAAVDRALRWFPRGTRMGHTGTLDPLATGVLVLCLGGATRLAEYVQRMSKTYVSTFRLGARSDTDDADGAVTPVPGAPAPAGAEVLAGLAGMVGTIEQVPPAFSAAKVTGQRAYDLARQGHEVSLRSRTVEVYDLIVRRYDYPELEVEVRCGKGTYVRALARDLGERLGCGAYVQGLRRTRVGPFGADDAVTLEATAEEARARLLPPALAVSELPRVAFGPRQWERFQRGQAVPSPGGAPAGEGGEVAVFDAAGRLLAVAAVDAGRGLLRPARVLA
jgi:tRNA pseudouridine55 synthase